MRKELKRELTPQEQEQVEKIKAFFADHPDEGFTAKDIATAVGGRTDKVAISTLLPILCSIGLKFSKNPMNINYPGLWHMPDAKGLKFERPGKGLSVKLDRVLGEKVVTALSLVKDNKLFAKFSKDDQAAILDAHEQFNHLLNH